LPELPKTGGAGRHSKGDEIGGHAKGEEEPSSGVARPKRSRKPPVDCHADSGEAEGGGVEQDRGELEP
jgi:hypothetical protein